MFNQVNANIMKLMLFVPNLVLIAISGINLSNEISNDLIPASPAIMVLHGAVLAICITICILLVRSMFAVKYVEVSDEVSSAKEERYEELDWQHSA